MSKRVVTFGRQPTEKPKHALTEIHFPELAKLDEGTNEGMISRLLTSEGGDVRALPRTIFFQKEQKPGHDDSVAVGSLHEITFDGETGIMSGKGWVVDTADGRDAALHVASKALFHNSVDLSEVKVSVVEHGDFMDDDFYVEFRFVNYKVAATTLVGKPAFADAHAIIPDEDFDLTAALEAGPLVVGGDVDHTITIDVHAESDEEVMASAAGVPPWEYFHKPESDKAQKIVVGEADENGWIPVYGHLSKWGSCHDGIEGRCVITPRPPDNYASFNKPSVLTNRGQVEAGPISLLGGHVDLKKAADDPANAWCDVRVIPGVHGPWLSGVVRPHVAEDAAKTYVARASRISGHWKGGRLKMIVSCNAEGFDVPGTGFTTNSRGEIDELVASFPICDEEPAPAPKPTNVSDTFLALYEHYVQTTTSGNTTWDGTLNGDPITDHTTTHPTYYTTDTTDTKVTIVDQEAVDREAADAEVVEVDIELERRRQAALLDLED